MEVSCLRSPIAHFPFQSFSDVTVVCLEKEETQASTGTHYPFNRAMKRVPYLSTSSKLHD